MSGSIYLIKDDDELVEMTEQAYDSEDLLQKLLAKYPKLLAGEQMDSDSPRRWLLVSREMGVPSEEEGADRWALDHLFLDQDGIPTLVEVKRSSDTRIRREVVGQMLDYAANAVVYWPVQEIRAKFEANVKAGGDPDDVLNDFLQDQSDVEEFWQTVKTNLQAGKVRMLFVADKIPTELRRIVEFLNEQMDPAEVLAVEIKQYVGPEQKTLVPRVIGQTAAASRSAPRGKLWDEPSFFSKLKNDEMQLVKPAQAILEWAKANLSQISWGRGRQSGSFTPILEHGGISHRLVTIWTNDYVQVPFGHMKSEPPFDAKVKRLELSRRLNEIDQVTLPDDTEKYPSFPLSALKDGSTVQQFLEVLDWAVQEIKAS